MTGSWFWDLVITAIAVYTAIKLTEEGSEE